MGACSALSLLLLTIPGALSWAVGVGQGRPGAPVSRASAIRAVASPPKNDEFQKASFDTSIAEIPKCPETRWDTNAIELEAFKNPSRTLPVEIRRDAAATMSEEEWVKANRDSELIKNIVLEDQ